MKPQRRRYCTPPPSHVRAVNPCVCECHNRVLLWHNVSPLQKFDRVAGSIIDDAKWGWRTLDGQAELEKEVRHWASRRWLHC